MIEMLSIIAGTIILFGLGLFIAGKGLAPFAAVAMMFVIVMACLQGKREADEENLTASKNNINNFNSLKIAPQIERPDYKKFTGWYSCRDCGWKSLMKGYNCMKNNCKSKNSMFKEFK